MIHESWHWKKPLLESATRLEALKTTKRVSEKKLVQLEKDIFIGFYSVRKLLEAPAKITDEVKATRFPITWYPNRGEKVTWRNNHRLDELYDFETSGDELRDIFFICGRIIHSFIFSSVFAEKGGIEAILFTSDTDKEKRLYSMNIDRVIELFLLVGSNDPVQIIWSRDPKTGEEKTVVM